MGEILQDLIMKRDRLVRKKAQIQNFDMIGLDAQIAKLTNIINKITAGGWD